MKISLSAGLFALALQSSVDIASAQVLNSPATGPQTPISAADQLWPQVGIAANGGAASPAQALRVADLARTFVTQFPHDPRATEGRKLEALFLIDAADDGTPSTQGRMEKAVADFRKDASVPAFQRAIVAGTYEFHTASRQIKSPADMSAEYETVARGLIKEFPDQPQGYVSLLTEALLHDDATARSMAQEVLSASAAPTEARTTAQRLVTRLDLLGRPVGGIFGSAPLGPDGQTGWPQGRPGLIYFWATWSPDSLRFGEKLAARKLTAVNVMGVCLDSDATAAAQIAVADKLPGRLVYVPNGVQGDLAVRLGADAAPLLYLVGADGKFTDVRGLEGLTKKLAALGL